MEVKFLDAVLNAEGDYSFLEPWGIIFIRKYVLFIYIFLKIIKEVSSQVYLQRPIELRQQRFFFFFFFFFFEEEGNKGWYIVGLKSKKREKNCYKLMDEIKFSHCIINELFRNTSWGVVDTLFFISQLWNKNLILEQNCTWGQNYHFRSSKMLPS